MTSLAPKRWTVSSEAGKAAGVPLALFIALAANAWGRAEPNDLDHLIEEKLSWAYHGAIYQIFHAISFVASVGGAVVATAMAAAYMWRKRHDVVAALAIVVASGLSGLMTVISCGMVKRPRPHEDGLANITDYVFPAGHAAGFAAVTTMVCLLIAAKRIPVANRTRVTIFLAVLGFLACFVRVLTHVHYFTDAAAGLSLGSGIAGIVTALLPAADALWAKQAVRLLRSRDHK